MNLVKPLQLLAAMAPAAFAQNAKQATAWHRVSNMLRKSAQNSTSDCPEGEELCGADLEWGLPGYCMKKCCDWKTEVICYDETFKPESCAPKSTETECFCPGEVKCLSDPKFGDPQKYCTPVCCDLETEEHCYDSETKMEFCVPRSSEKSCSCPGEVECGADPEHNLPGFCTKKVCCDKETEVPCWDYETGAKSCKPKVDAPGCACPGEVRCNKSTNSLGNCIPAELCNKDTEGMQANTFAAFVQAKGTPTDIHHFHSLEKKFLVHESTPSNSAKMLALEREQIKLVRAIKLREEKRFEKHVLAENEAYVKEV